MLQRIIEESNWAHLRDINALYQHLHKECDLMNEEMARFGIERRRGRDFSSLTGNKCWDVVIFIYYYFLCYCIRLLLYYC